MTTIEYMSLSASKKILYKIGSFFMAIPLGIYHFFRKIPSKTRNLFKKISNPFVTLVNSFVNGDWKTRISYVVMGFGQITNHQYIRGFFNLIFEVCFITYLIITGIPNLIKLPTFGNIASVQYDIDVEPFTGYVYMDDSFNILLFSVITILLILVFIYLWYTQIKEALSLQEYRLIGHVITDSSTINDLTGKNYHKVLLALPTSGLVLFTIIPLIFMVLVGFTDYNSNYMNPKELFDWVGMSNFSRLLGLSGEGGNQFVGVFLQILLWTLVWAFFATFTNYFLGMIIALLINRKGIKLKKLWRTVLITTIAVPQFVSLLLLSKVLNTNLGAMNALLQQLGWITENIKFLEDGMIAKVTIIVVNMWIGIPYTMLICTGLLMNIPADLYESAKIDGASPFKMYVKITLPYMLFVTGPYLISQFVGNINNFNVIYLLSGGGPVFTSVNGIMISTNVFGAGQTDLLITWLYKIAMGEVFKDYGVASVIGICVFVIVSLISLVFYGRSNSVKNEEDFQ